MSDVLGYYLWSTVSSGSGEDPLDISDGEVSELFRRLELNQTFMPPSRRGIDAFRTSTSAINHTYEVNGIKVAITTRETERTEEFVSRQVLRTADGVSPVVVAEIKFYRPTRKTAGRVAGTESWRMNVRQDLPEPENTYIREFLDQFGERYERDKGQLAPGVVRTYLRDYLYHLNAICVKAKGGLYFVHAQYLDEIDRIGHMVQRLGPACDFHWTECLDTPKQRAMLQELVRQALKEDVDQLETDINEARQRWKGAVPITKVGELRERYKTILRTAEEHATILGLGSDTLVDDIVRAQELVKDLQIDRGRAKKR